MRSWACSGSWGASLRWIEHRDKSSCATGSCWAVHSLLIIVQLRNIQLEMTYYVPGGNVLSTYHLCLRPKDVKHTYWIDVVVNKAAIQSPAVSTFCHIAIQQWGFFCAVYRNLYDGFIIIVLFPKKLENSVYSVKDGGAASCCEDISFSRTNWDTQINKTTTTKKTL